MNRIPLKAEERTILGKKVRNLRKQGFVPGHVYGNNIDTEHVTVSLSEFTKVYDAAGETGLIDLKIGEEKIKPVLIRDVQYHVVTDMPLNIDFYQVNLKEKVTVPVPLVLVGEEPELVHTGEAIVLQNLSEVEVEALPTDLVENIEVNIVALKQIDDAITLGDLTYDRETLTILAEPEEVVVKLAPAVTEEMQQLLEEQEAEAAAAAEAEGAEGEEGATEGGEEGETTEESTEEGGGEEAESKDTEEKSAEE